MDKFGKFRRQLKDEMERISHGDFDSQSRNAESKQVREKVLKLSFCERSSSSFLFAQAFSKGLFLPLVKGWSDM